MNKQTNWWLRIRIGLLLMSSGTLFVVPGIGCIQTAAGSVARNFNPCGTILICDPVEYDFAIGRLDPYNPDFEDCPISVDPADCLNGVWPPLGGGGGNVNGQATTN